MRLKSAFKEVFGVGTFSRNVVGTKARKQGR